MPKIIKNLRSSILKCAKDELLEKGYDALNIRAVARECGIAVGTVYNYFPSKETLAAHIMMEDWARELERIRLGCELAQSVSEALRALYDGVTAFYAIYRSVWEGYNFSAGAKSAYGSRRNMLVRQLADCVSAALERFAPSREDGFDIFVAENALVCAGGSLMTFESFERIAARAVQ